MGIVQFNSIGCLSIPLLLYSAKDGDRYQHNSFFSPLSSWSTVHVVIPFTPIIQRRVQSIELKQQMTDRVFPSQEGGIDWSKSDKTQPCPQSKNRTFMIFALLTLVPRWNHRCLSPAWDRLPFQRIPLVVAQVHLQQTDRWNAYSISSGTWFRI